MMKKLLLELLKKNKKVRLWKYFQVMEQVILWDGC